MTTFTKGQKVRRTHGPAGFIAPGEEFTVAAAGLDRPGNHWIALEGQGWGFLASDFELVDDTTLAPTDLPKVKVGDTVTVMVDDDSIGSFEVKGEVRGHLGGTWSVGPINVASNGNWHEGVTITDYQPAPAPEPYTPTTERIRSMYVHDRADDETLSEQEAGQEFDRWFASLAPLDPA